jgi:integrase/recombinase XerD
MMLKQIDITQLEVAQNWRVEFGLWLRQSPTQKRRERSHLSVSAYTSDIEQMSRWFTSRYDVQFAPDHLNSANLQEYFSGLECAPATYNRKLASVRMLIKWSRLVGVLDYDPSEWTPLQDATRESPRDVVEDDRVMLEMAAEENESTLIGLRDSLIFFLMSNAGLRISEVVGLKLSDLHLDKNYIHVFGKGSKHRKVKVKGRLAEKINAWIERMPESIEGTLITDERGLSIERGQAWRRFVLIAERAGVNATPHAMRHTFVIRYMEGVMRGDAKKLPAAIDAVCQQTGDRPEVVLAYYTRASDSDMLAAAELM